MDFYFLGIQFLYRTLRPSNVASMVKMGTVHFDGGSINIARFCSALSQQSPSSQSLRISVEAVNMHLRKLWFAAKQCKSCCRTHL